MFAAQEMFKTANKVTRPEKALILGFMAGSRGGSWAGPGPGGRGRVGLGWGGAWPGGGGAGGPGWALWPWSPPSGPRPPPQKTRARSRAT